MHDAQQHSKFDPDRLTEAIADLVPEAVAVHVGVSVATLYRWRRGGAGEPDASQLAAIAQLTGRPLAFFFRPSKSAA